MRHDDGHSGSPRTCRGHSAGAVPRPATMRSSLGNVTVPDLAGGENLTMNDRALVLLSGGQDSTVCLAWALDRFAHVETIGFDYGQKHRVEIDVRPNVLAAIRRGFPAWAEKLGEDHLIDLTVLGRMSDTALTRDVAIRFEANGLPNTFVPGRNLLFLTFAAATAYRRDVQSIPANAQIDLQNCAGNWCHASWRNLAGYLPAFAPLGDLLACECQAIRARCAAPARRHRASL